MHTLIECPECDGRQVHYTRVGDGAWYECERCGATWADEEHDQRRAARVKTREDTLSALTA